MSVVPTACRQLSTATTITTAREQGERENSRHTHTMAPAAVATFNEILMCTQHNTHTTNTHGIHRDIHSVTHTVTLVHTHTRLRICTN